METAMTNEVENKAVVKDSQNMAEDASRQTFNAIDLLKEQANSKSEIKSGASEASARDVLGNLEIQGIKTGDKLEDWIGKKILDSKFEVLNKTETMILNGVQDAIRSGSVDKVQDMLAALSENPKSVDRVLRALKDQMESESSLNQVNWEQGKDNNGNEFVRLHLYRADSNSKSAGGTELTIGSDGRNSATFRDRWDSPAKPMSPDAAINEFANPKLRDYRDYIDPYIKPYPIEKDPRTIIEQHHQFDSSLKKN
jgi:hypothetical protein